MQYHVLNTTNELNILRGYRSCENCEHVCRFLAGFRSKLEVPHPLASKGFHVVCQSVHFSWRNHSYQKRNDPVHSLQSVSHSLPTYPVASFSLHISQRVKCRQYTGSYASLFLMILSTPLREEGHAARKVLVFVCEKRRRSEIAPQERLFDARSWLLAGTYIWITDQIS